jgi:hypothetical protein
MKGQREGVVNQVPSLSPRLSPERAGEGGDEAGCRVIATLGHPYLWPFPAGSLSYNLRQPPHPHR